jgi:probable phosphoglycerate mutase
VSGRRLVIEADGGSRGNPGPAAYGAVVRDASTGHLLAEVGQTIGVATNNVAEYRGLLAGLMAVHDIDPQATVEVRLDSKLVVEQMSGRWKIKDPTLRSIAIQARDVLPAAQVSYTWIPREQNKAADALVNRALDGQPIQSTHVAPEVEAKSRSVPGFSPDLGEPTLLLLGRHGATEHSIKKVFSGRGGEDPPLADVGREQALALANELVARGGADRIVSSPMLRARQTADIVAEVLGLTDVDIVEDLAECAFGEWDGHTFGEVGRQWPDELGAWLRSTAVAPPGGESFDDHYDRIERARVAILESSESGDRVVVIAHVSPIKMMMAIALEAPVHSLFHLQLQPCSLTSIAWWRDANCTVMGFAESAHLRGLDHTEV